ncbi:MAG: substrate-binding domain-containing protein [Christensenellaceae bacterium]|nr:substrate-binding domain-containing protein [Christensenellaceae bacterium]
MKKILSLLLVIVMVCVLFTACGTKATEAPAPADEPKEEVKEEVKEEAAEPAEESEGYQIGVSVPSMEYTFFAQMETEINNVYPTDDVTVTVYDGENNQEKQNKDVEDMITMGYDGIVLIPITVEGAAPAIAYANEKKVPVITVDREVTPDAGVEVIGFVGADHVPMGEGSAELLIAALEKMYPDEEKWNVIELEGTQGASATLLRGEGIHNVLDKDPRINIISSLDANFSTTEALSIAEDSLIANEDLHAFIGHNDDIAIGCYQALVNANKVGKVAITGIDGTLACVEKVADGGIQGTVIQFPAMVTLGVETLVKYLNGEEVEFYNYYPTEKIAPEDAQSFIDAGKPY